MNAAWIRNAVVGVGLRFGVQIRSRKHLLSERFRRQLALREIELVVDVGANEGQFGAELFGTGYRGILVSFEPVPHVHEALARRASSTGTNWIVAKPVALSDREGTAEITVAGATALSSLLPATDLLRSLNTTASAAETVEVPLRTLAAELGHYLDPLPGRYALKIDTQGTELEVLKGASLADGRVELILLELSLAELYSGQSLYFDVDETLRRSGFVLVDVEPGYRSSGDQLFQFDAIYARRRPGEYEVPRDAEKIS